MNRKKAKRIGCCVSSAMMIARAFACSLTIQAEELEYAGTTQIMADSYYLNVDTFTVELVVEEVYAKAGDRLAQGDQILKLTEDSYGEAVDYYTAAVMHADSNLTDIQLEYDQGILESKYTYETAQAKAEMAKTVKEYQEQELTDTISAHEEILDEINTRIAELESWTETSGSGASSGSGVSSGSQQNKGASEEESEPFTQKIQEKETEDSDQKLSERESESQETQFAETETEAITEKPDHESETQTDSEETERETGTEETELHETDEEGRQQAIETWKSQLEVKNQEYSEILKQLEALGFSLSVQEGDNQTESNSTPESEEEIFRNTLQESIEGNQNVKTNLENVQENLEDVPELVMVTVKAAYPDYEDYIKLLGECIEQLNADIQIQETVKQTLENECGESNSDINMEKLQTLLSSLVKIGEEKRELYNQWIMQQEKWIEDLQEKAQSTESETQSEDVQQGESVQTDKNGQLSGNGQSADNGSSPAAGGSALNPSSGTGKSSGGMSMGSGGSSYGSADALSGGTVQTDSSVSLLSSGKMSISEEDISLFGNTYDLTQVENLLEKEPSDSDGAKELAEQLADSQKTVESQYEKLVREQKITELGIQYTYDTSVIAGKLAEFKYQEELLEWKETLSEAREEKEELEARKAFLDSMTDGILTADRGGIVSEVSCEAGDTINRSTPVISYYNMDTVTISIEVPQEEISELQVGDSVDVTINGMWNREGVVVEKTLEPQSGTSRTTVHYEVTIAIDNSDESLTSGLPASVTAYIEESASGDFNPDQMRNGEKPEGVDRGQMRGSRSGNSDSGQPEDGYSFQGRGSKSGRMNQETKTVYLPVSVVVHTDTDAEMTFSILKAGDELEFLFEENEDGEEMITEIWLMSTESETV